MNRVALIPADIEGCAWILSLSRSGWAAAALCVPRLSGRGGAFFWVVRAGSSCRRTTSRNEPFGVLRDSAERQQADKAFILMRLGPASLSRGPGSASPFGKRTTGLDSPWFASKPGVLAIPLTYFISENKMNIANVVAMVARIGAAVERFNIAGRAFGKRRGGQAPSNGLAKRRESSQKGGATGTVVWFIEFCVEKRGN